MTAVTAQLTKVPIWMAGLLFVAFVMLTGIGPAEAAERPRLALVIGISDYHPLPALKNAANDGRLITDSLLDVGFEVTSLTNPSNAELRRGIVEFAAQIAEVPDPIVVVYYAGQGIQVDGTNYLIPRDAAITTEADLELEGVSLTQLIDRLGSANAAATFLMFFDACNDNPFAAASTTRGAVRLDAQRGLAPVDVGRRRMVVMYATAPGRQALDGSGSNGPFALALAKNLKTPGLEFLEFARLVRDDVLASTNGYQNPWVQTGLIEPFYFNAVATAPIVPEKDAKTRAAEVLYEAQPGEMVATYEDGSYALLVGVSHYDETLKAWRDLPAVGEEIDELGRTLEIMHGFKVKTLLDPTGRALETAIKDFVNEHGSKTNARLLFFFSGHGITIENKLTRKKVGWFIPKDAPHHIDSPIPFANTALNMSRIAEWSELMEAKHVLWVFDSCFSGVALRMMEKKGDEAIKPWEIHLHLAPVRRVITAGSENQEVPAESRFTRQFTRVLRGDVKVGDRDDLITGAELGDFLKQDIVDATYGTDLPQTPQSDTIIIPDSDSGDIVFRIEPDLIAGIGP
ncbi:caspase family protein [Taklimakanibacter lacteus]|uniref:caspase family protein n=1 Tax=Taklimakanibacter lacteus TaxID=2268456 RepID=UPI000E6720BB